MKNATCPSCDAEIEIGAMPSYGLRLECPACDAVLKIIWLDPVELDWWDYDDEDEREDNFFDDEDEVSYYDEMAYISVHTSIDEVDIDEVFRANLDIGIASSVEDGVGDGLEDTAEDYLEDRELLDN